jgi:PKD repeat protein
MLDIVFDGAGPDLMVFEGDGSAEGYTLYAGEPMDGPWHSMGTGSGTSEFDFENCNISEARYFKIQDDGDGSSSGNDAGFDLDAMQALSSVTGPYLVMDGVVIDDASGNNNGQLDPGETAEFTVTLKNVGTEEAVAITGTFSTEDEYINILTTAPQTFGNIAIDGTAEATFTVSAEDDAPAGHTSTIDFNYEGTNIAPATKYIQVPFPDYCYPSANCGFGDGFTGFQLEDINNMNNGCSNDNGVEGYGDFTDMSTDLEPGQSYDLTWQTGYSDQDASLWIDFNMNKEFEDDERLVTDYNMANSGTPYTVTIEIPEDVLPGEKRLRIRANWQNSSADPCGSFSYGETEDYTVNITGDILQAGFYADETEICHGTEVQFHDNSLGNITSWYWEFPGGNPPTSTEEDPMVTYETPGFYGVTLTISNGTNQSTETMMEYMLVHDDPAVPDAPTGETVMCQDAPDCDYSTDPGTCTDWYWEMDPPAAGTMVQNGPAITVDWNPDFVGEVQIMVAGMNMCGQSSMSTPIDITIEPMPESAGSITGLNDVCQGWSEIYTIDEIAFSDDYEWVLEPVEAGAIDANAVECAIGFSMGYQGPATLKVRGMNECGEGEWSADFDITVNICSGVFDGVEKAVLNVLPNPNNGIFELELNNIVDKKLHLELYSAGGELVFQTTQNTNSAQQVIGVNVQNYPSGVYYLKVTGNETLITKKILINK